MTDREITTFYRGVQKWCAEAGYEVFLHSVQVPLLSEMLIGFNFHIRPIGKFDAESLISLQFSASARYFATEPFNIPKQVAASLARRYEEAVR